MTMINNNKSSDDDDNEVLPDLPFKFSPLRETKTPSLLPLKKVSKRKLNLPPDSQKEIMAEYSTVKKKDFSLDNLLKEKKKSIKKQKGIDSYYKEIINSSKNNNNNNNDNNNNNGGGGSKEVSPTASLIIHNDDDDVISGKKVEDSAKEGYYIYTFSNLNESTSSTLKFNLLSLNVYSNNDLLSFLLDSNLNLSCLEVDLIVGELMKRRKFIVGNNKKDNCYDVLKDYGLLYSSSSSSSDYDDYKKIKKTFSTPPPPSTTTDSSSFGLLTRLKLSLISSLSSSSSVQKDNLSLCFYSLLLLLLDGRMIGYYVELQELMNNIVKQDTLEKGDVYDLLYKLFDGDDGLHGLVDFIRVIPDYFVVVATANVATVATVATATATANDDNKKDGIREDLALYFLLKSLGLLLETKDGDDLPVVLLKQKLCLDLDLKNMDYDLYKCQLELLWYCFSLLIQKKSNGGGGGGGGGDDLVECLYNLSKKINDRKAVSLERTEVKDLLMRIHQTRGGGGGGSGSSRSSRS